jgi:hypothetical protein
MASTPVGSRMPERRCDWSTSRPHGWSPPRWVGQCGRSERRWFEVVVERGTGWKLFSVDKIELLRLGDTHVRDVVG